MSGLTFVLILEVVFFLALLWVAGRLCRLIPYVTVSPLIGEIAVGMFMGPNGLDLVPGSIQYSFNQDSHECHEVHGTSLWEIAGTIGVTLMIAESGTHIHFDKIKKVGMAALGVAILGTLVPFIAGFGLSFAFQSYHESDVPWEAAFAVGCSLAPTSVGVALKLLTDAKQLNSLPGQTIVTAAFMDDIFSIILLVVLQSIGGENEDDTGFNVVPIIISFVSALLFLVIGTFLAIKVFAPHFHKITHKIRMMDNKNFQPRDELHLFLMMAVLVFYCYIGSLIGSHLLGAFIAGMSFSQVRRSMYVWRRQLKRISSWLIRMFFAASVAFTIPVSTLLSGEAFWRGLILVLVGGILGKMIAGLASWEYRYIVGFAMVGRGEFAYLVSGTAQSLNIISNKLYAVIVWSLLIAVMVAPIAFEKVLAIFCAGKPKTNIKYFTIQIEGHHHTGLHFELVDVLHNLRLDILEAKVETDGDVDAVEFTVAVADGELDGDKIEEITRDLKEAVGDLSTQVLLQPIDEHDTLPIFIEAQRMKEYLRDGHINEKEFNAHHCTARFSLKKVTEDSTPIINAVNTKKIDFDTIMVMNGINEHGQAVSPAKSPSSLNTNDLKLISIEKSLSHQVQHSNLQNLSNHRSSSMKLTSMSIFTNIDCNDYWIEVKLMSAHKPHMFTDMVDVMESNGITLVKGHMEDFMNTDSEVLYGRVKEQNIGIDLRLLKKELKLVLSEHNIEGEILVKKVQQRYCVLPHHPKFSDLLRTCQPNNPLLLDMHNCVCGFELSIICDDAPRLLHNIDAIFRALDLDIRSADVEELTLKKKWKGGFFVKEANHVHKEYDSQKIQHSIESQLKHFFLKHGLHARFKLIAIEMGNTNMNQPQPKLKMMPQTINMDLGYADNLEMAQSIVIAPSILKTVIADGNSELVFPINSPSDAGNAYNAEGLRLTRNNSESEVRPIRRQTSTSIIAFETFPQLINMPSMRQARLTGWMTTVEPGMESEDLSSISNTVREPLHLDVVSVTSNNTIIHHKASFIEFDINCDGSALPALGCIQSGLNYTPEPSPKAFIGGLMATPLKVVSFDDYNDENEYNIDTDSVNIIFVDNDDLYGENAEENNDFNADKETDKARVA